MAYRSSSRPPARSELDYAGCLRGRAARRMRSPRPPVRTQRERVTGLATSRFGYIDYRPARREAASSHDPCCREASGQGLLAGRQERGLERHLVAGSTLLPGQELKEGLQTFEGDPAHGAWCTERTEGRAAAATSHGCAVISRPPRADAEASPSTSTSGYGSRDGWRPRVQLAEVLVELGLLRGRRTPCCRPCRWDRASGHRLRRRRPRSGPRARRLGARRPSEWAGARR